MYEHKNSRLLPRKKFYHRVARHFIFSQCIAAVALGIGMVGYHFTEKLSWLDSYANAAMILSGMGPLMSPVTVCGKFFAGSYALFSGLVFITVTGIILAPMTHRFLHKFHLEDEKEKNK